jgi:hypothetical protein
LISITLIICFFLIYKHKQKAIHELSYFSLSTFFIIKLGAASFFLYVYSYHYGGGELTADAGRFLEEAKVLNRVFEQSPKIYFQLLFNIDTSQEMINTYLEATSHWNATERIIPNDSRNVIRVNSILLFLSNGNIFFHFIIFSFISFFAGLDLFQFVKKHSSLKSFWIIFALTLTPSIAFWGGSIIKEPLLLAGMMILVRGLFDQLPPIKRMLRITIGLGFMMLFKPYILMIFAPFILLFFLLKAFHKYSRILIAAVYFTVLFTMGHLSGVNEKALYMISKQQEDFINLRDGGLYLIADQEHYIYIYYTNRNKFEITDGYATLKEPTGAYYMKANENYNRSQIQLNEVGKSWEIGVSLEKVGSGVSATPINGSWSQLIKNIPNALINTIIRPFPWDNGSWLKHLAFLENMFLLFALIMTAKKLKTTKVNINLLLTFSLFAISIFLVAGWTTPVLGAVVRYKVPATLICVMLVLIYWKDSPKGIFGFLFKT